MAPGRLLRQDSRAWAASSTDRACERLTWITSAGTAALASWLNSTWLVFTHGSINWMADGDPFPASSDLDLAVVVAEIDPARHRPRKRRYGEIVIESFHLPPDRSAKRRARSGRRGRHQALRR